MSTDQHQQPPPPSSPRTLPISVCLDVELADRPSRDIDDTLLLLLLAGDTQRFRLRCVTLTPGTSLDQVRIARRILELTGHSQDSAVPIGVQDAAQLRDNSATNSKKKGQNKKKARSPVMAALGIVDTPSSSKSSSTIDDSLDDNNNNIQEASKLLADCLRKDKNCLVITGSSLTNFSHALHEDDDDNSVTCARWLGQGGYPPPNFLQQQQQSASSSEKNTALSTTSYNLTKDLEATSNVLEAVRAGRIGQGLLVSSKCHDTNVLSTLLPRLAIAAETQNLRKLYKSSSDRTRRQRSLETILKLCSSIRGDKKMHDVLLAAVALDPSIASWTDGVVLEYDKTDQGGAVLWQSHSSSQSDDESRLRVTWTHVQRASLEVLLPLPDGVYVDHDDNDDPVAFNETAGSLKNRKQQHGKKASKAGKIQCRKGK